MTRYLLAYAGTFVALAALDFLWLGVLARSFYREGIGHLMAPAPNLVAAAAFYLLYPVGLVVFAVLPAGGDWPRTLALGALFGAFCYGTYDLTSLAILKDWPLPVTLVDIAWGAVVSAAGASAGAWVLRWLVR
ncbi:DUF2177 family protein [Caenimonas terrae]|uniref:DUF2177 family protein n=1 Tax=Caenimonas terrae TaxID=696074 RepID=A0ABW0N7D9_9BURK